MYSPSFLQKFYRFSSYTKFYDPFWVDIHVGDVRSRSGFIYLFFACEYPAVPASFVEKTILSPLNGLTTLARFLLRHRCPHILNLQKSSLPLISFSTARVPMFHEHRNVILKIRFSASLHDSPQDMLMYPTVLS